MPPGTTTNDGDAIRDDIGVGKRHARDTTSNATTIGAGEEAATGNRDEEDPRGDIVGRRIRRRRICHLPPTRRRLRRRRLESVHHQSVKKSKGVGGE